MFPNVYYFYNYKASYCLLPLDNSKAMGLSPMPASEHGRSGKVTGMCSPVAMGLCTWPSLTREPKQTYQNIQPNSLLPHIAVGNIKTRLYTLLPTLLMTQLK